MGIYRQLFEWGSRYIGRRHLLKWGFNYSPMYRRTTAKITDVSTDLRYIRLHLPLSWKNKNYMGTVFGGSMFAAVDPIPMIQLVYALGNQYVIWDKSAQINFKRPGTTNLYAEFQFTAEEINQIRDQVARQNEIVWPKTTLLKSVATDQIICEVEKQIYIADKAFYKNKRAARKQLEH